MYCDVSKQAGPDIASKIEIANGKKNLNVKVLFIIKNTKFVKDLPMIDAQFRFNQCNSFREEYISVFSPYGSVLIL
jgi:hypothetical protein